jgi:pimeloyl-ACP methyl ester carboxylesterase
VKTEAIERLATTLLSRLPTAREEALAVVNGAFGDRLAAAGSPLALDLDLFVGEERKPLENEASAHPAVCLFVHGLMGSQHAWSLGTEHGDRLDYGWSFQNELDVTPLYARFNSGLHISTNGRELARRFSNWFDTQDEPPKTIDIVAHSMGGLVARSAMHYALASGASWPERIERVFLLGTPNHGARLEQFAHVTAFTLESIWNPWTKLIGKAINLRADGIKDLRHGFCLDEDWIHKNQDALRLAAPRPTRSPAGARWFVAAAQLGKKEDWKSKLLGDGLVRPHSAEGHGFGSHPSGVLPSVEFRLFERRTHLSLMNEPEVLSQIVDWWKADEVTRLHSQ